MKAAAAQNKPEELAALAQQLPEHPPASILPMLQRLQLDTVSTAEERQLQRSTMLALRLAGLI